MKTKYIEELEKEIKKWRDSHKNGEFIPDYCVASDTLRETITMLSNANERVKELEQVLNSDIMERVNFANGAWKQINMNDTITRVEIIDKDGRTYVNMKAKDFELSYQDDGKTLKIFID